MVNMRRPDGLVINNLDDTFLWSGVYTHGSITDEVSEYRTYVWLTRESGYLVQRIDGQWVEQPMQERMYEQHAAMLYDYGWAIRDAAPVNIILNLPQHHIYDTIREGPVIADNYWVGEIDDSNYVILKAGVFQNLANELIYMQLYGSARGIDYTNPEDVYDANNERWRRQSE